MPESVKVTFHGGLGDIGRNCATIETDDAMLILDCGVLFPSDVHPGVDFVLPDLSYIFEHADRVVGCITTHGHEDHIGALAHLLPEVPTAIYGSAFTLGLARRRVAEANLTHLADWRELTDGQRCDIGPFSCEFLPVTHSVPGGLISAIGTPQGIILHSSDFKLDPTPVDGRHTDLPRIRELSQDPGIRLLLVDSTNADTPGSTASETAIGPALDRVFTEHSRDRMVVACFASHLHRVQQIANCALRDNRKIALLGLSMKRNVKLGLELGIIDIPSNALIDAEDADDYRPHEVCLITTGSQAESRSSLATASRGDNRWVTLGEDDTVVLSSHPIPGNEVAVARMINQLTALGARVVQASHLHTSGHGKRDELAALHTAAAPEWFVPVHGEFRHLVAHAELAVETGLDYERVLVAVDGDQIELSDDKLELRQNVTPGDYLLAHGSMVEVDQGFLRERIWLGEEGVVTVAAVVSGKPSKRKLTVEVESRGWVNAPDREELEAQVAAAVKQALLEDLKQLDQSPDSVAATHALIRKVGGKSIKGLTGRRPLVLPLVSFG